jgi:LacI family transcriptional regulator/LacI family fructose operon transcriptional repressor
MAKSPQRLPSMQDVAAAAGVHQTTVSLALRNDRRLPEATRLRIQRIAQKMNYRSHPLVAALVALRRARRPPRFHATLAFVLRNTQRGPSCALQFEGASEAAEIQGYKLDRFVLGDVDLTEQRLDSVLHARNIHGILIAPLPESHGSFNLAWENFSTVALEYTFIKPVFDRVVNDAYGGMRRIMAECRRRGLHRVGLLLTEDGDERTEHRNGAAFWVEQKADGFFAAIPPLYPPAWDQSAFEAWHRRYHPEVIVTSNVFLGNVQAWIARSGLGPGRDVHLINVNAAENGPISGVCQNPRVMGATAARLVIEKITRNERGIPEFPHTISSPGHWIEGSTLCPVGAVE